MRNILSQEAWSKERWTTGWEDTTWTELITQGETEKNIINKTQQVQGVDWAFWLQLHELIKISSPAGALNQPMPIL